MGKTRVFELAKELEMNSKVLMEKMQQMGLTVKSYMSTVEDNDIARVKDALINKEKTGAPNKEQTEKNLQQTQAAKSDQSDKPDRPAKPGPARDVPASETPRPGQAPGPARTAPATGPAQSSAPSPQTGARRPPGNPPEGSGSTTEGRARQPAQPGGSPRPAQATAPYRPGQASPPGRPGQAPGPARTAPASGPAQASAPYKQTGTRPPGHPPEGSGSPTEGRVRQPAQPGGSPRPAQATAPYRPGQASQPGRPGQAPGPARTAPASGPGQASAPYKQTGARPPGHPPEGSGSPTEGRARQPAQPGGSSRPAQAPGPNRPGQASQPGRHPQTPGSSRTTAQRAPAGSPQGAAPGGYPAGKRPAQASDQQARTGGRPTGKTETSAQDAKIVVQKDDYKKKAIERRDEQRRTQEQSQRKLLSKVTTIAGRSHGKRRRKPAPHHAASVSVNPMPQTVNIEERVTVQDLASKMQVDPGVVIRKLIELGVMATLNQAIDADTAALIAHEFGADVEISKNENALEAVLEDSDEEETALEMKPPVITVMGHVDHGKTSLLDAIREANVTATEAGGITQHIGAYQVELRGKRITFLDTPGHEAFTAMRARGAQVTDIAVLVVAADDGVMPQTIEAINHAKAADVSIVVAINKIDKSNANPDRVKQQLTEYDLVAEEWGGDTVVVPVSAQTKEGLEHLLEMLLLVAEMEEFKANPNRLARGTVIDARLDKGRGPVSTVLVQKGTLVVGDYILVGRTSGRVRAMLDFKGRRIKRAVPATPVEILGLSEVPNAGDPFYAVRDEKLARQIVDERISQKRQQDMIPQEKVTLEDLFKQIQQGKVKDLNLIVKADVQGSVEALLQSLAKLGTQEVRLNIIHSGVGAVTETDVMLASASKGLIIGYNVRPDVNAKRIAEMQQVEIRLYRVIYEIIDDVKAALEGLLEPELREVVTGRAVVRDIFSIPKIGAISGCYVSEGKMMRNGKVRVIRDGVVIYEGNIASLRRFKEDVREVQQGYECGIGLDKFQDIKQEDVIESYTIEEIKRLL